MTDKFGVIRTILLADQKRIAFVVRIACRNKVIDFVLDVVTKSHSRCNNILSFDKTLTNSQSLLCGLGHHADTRYLCKHCSIRPTHSTLTAADDFFFLIQIHHDNYALVFTTYISLARTPFSMICLPRISEG